MTTDTDTLTETPAAEAGDEGNSFQSSILAGLETLPAGSDTAASDDTAAADVKTDDPGDLDPEKIKTGEKAKVDEAKKPDTEEEVPEGLTKAAGSKWKELRQEAKLAKAKALELETKTKTYETQVVEMQAKLRELETANTQLAEVERLKEVVAEYESELTVSRVEATPEYKNSVIAPMAKLMNIADRIAKEYDPEGTGRVKERLLGIIETTDLKAQRKAIGEIASEWTEGDRFDLYQLGNDYQVIAARRDEIKANAKNALEQITAREREESERSAAEIQQAHVRAAGEVWERLAPHFADLPPEEVTKIRGQVTANPLDKENATGKAFAAYSAVLLPQVLKKYNAAVANTKALEAKVASLQKSKPGAGGGAGDDIKTPESDVSQGGFLAAVTSKIS